VNFLICEENLIFFFISVFELNIREEMLTMLKTCLVRQGLEEDGDEGVKVRAGNHNIKNK
jgi:hypothetical protein